MAKEVCKNCGAEVGFLQQVKMRDGNYVCRKCAAKTHPLFAPVNEKSLRLFSEHIKQLEEGKILYEKLFIPRRKPADKSKKLKNLGGGIEVAKDIGMVSVMRKRGGFIIWGGTKYYMVFRLADLFKYEYCKENSIGSNGKNETKHSVHLAFWDTNGYDAFKVSVASDTAYRSIAKYFNECFGLQRDLKNIGATWKNQIRDIKAAAQGAKTLISGNADQEEKDEAIEQLSQAAKNQMYGDRTEWIAKADAAIREALGK